MKQTRKLIDDSEVTELEFPVELLVTTKCPEKWKLIDLETGEEYIGTRPELRKKKKYWTRINNA